MKITKKIALIVLALIIFNMVRSFVQYMKIEREKYRKKGTDFENHLLKHENSSHLQDDTNHATTSGYSWHWHSFLDDCDKNNQFKGIYDNPLSTYKGSIDTSITTIFKFIFYIMSITVILTYILIVK